MAVKVLCVAEKNKISKGVAELLSNKHFQTKDTRNKYVKNYTFRCKLPQWGDCDITMTAVAGHILEKDLPKGYGWNDVRNVDLLSCPLIDRFSSKDSEKIASNIKDLAKEADILMIWTDCDREGEYIGYEIMVQAQTGNGRFNLDTTYRAKFSHLERNHIYAAACNPIRLDKNAIQAVSTRIEIDLRSGFCFTRLLTTSLKSYLQNDDKSLVSYGSCQFPTLGFVVDRAKRMKYFKSEEYWGINISIRKDRKKYPFSWSRNRLFDRLLTISIYQNCIENQGDNVVVTKVDNKPTTRYAPLPLTTVELQKDCSKYFKLSAKDTLNVAEGLYTKGFISYPRTETDSFPSKMDFKEYIGKQTQSSEWGDYAKMLIDDPSKFRIPRRGKNNDEAHPPIHPVSYAGSLTGREKQVYEYIVRRFLACCSLDAKGASTTITVRWSTEYFSTTGTVVLETNFYDIFKYANWTSSSKSLPVLAVGEQVPIADAKITSGKTSKPQPLTETELIALMDKNGIGTDATIAEHIEKIIQRQYVIKEKDGHGRCAKECLFPTPLGYALVDGFSKIDLQDISLTKPFLRKDMESDLSAICDGRKTKQEVLQETLKIYKDAYSITEDQMPLLIRAYRDSIRHVQSQT